MKKWCVLLAAVAVVFGMTSSAQAAGVTITFEETSLGITPGPNDTYRYDGTLIDDEYTGVYGVTWADIVEGFDFTGQSVTLPVEFNGSWLDSDAFLYYYGSDPIDGNSVFEASIFLSTPADYFSFEYRRPQKAGTIYVQFKLEGVELFESPLGLEWLVTDGAEPNDWDTYEYLGGQLFDEVVISSNDKFCTDTYQFNTVPIPASFWLLATGLIPMLRFRALRKK